MQHKRQIMESFPGDHEYLKRRKMDLSPAYSDFGDSYYSESDIEQVCKFLDTPPSDPVSAESFPDGKENDQRDFKNYHRGSTDSAYLSDETVEKERVKDHFEHDSKIAYREATDPDATDSGSELFEENSQWDSDREPTDPESLSGVLDETNTPDLLDEHGEHGSEYAYTESTDPEYFSYGAVELVEYKKLISEYSEKESSELINSPQELEHVNEIQLLKRSLCPFGSLNEYLWLPQFNDDSSYETIVYVTDETEEQQLERAIRNSMIENIPDKREVKRNRSRSRSVRFEETERDSKRVRFEENETDSIARCSDFPSKEDFIFSQFNVTGDVRTLHPEKFSESSEELSKKGHHFIADLLRNMTAKGQVGLKIDDEVRNIVLDMKEKMKGDKYLYIHWLAACLLQLYTDLHKQLDGVLQFLKRTGGETDKLYDEMAEMSSQYLSQEPDCHLLFSEIMDYFDDLQVNVFPNQSEGMKSSFIALKALAYEMRGLYERRLTYGNSDEDSYLNLSKVITFFCPLLVNFCDTAFHTVKKCKEFYRLRNYVISRLSKN